MDPTTNPECLLKPGETCHFCNYRRPKKQAKAKLTCGTCGEEFKKDQKRRLLRGKWVHKNEGDCW